MPLLIFFFAGIFVCITFVSRLDGAGEFPTLLRYFIFQFSVIGRHFFLFLLIVIITASFLVISFTRKKKRHFFGKFALSLYHTGIGVLLGLATSYIFLLFIALIELNILSVLLRINPQFAGVITDRSKIVSSLKTNNTVPQIITSDPDQYKEVLSLAAASTGRHNFYATDVISVIPGIMVVPVGKSPTGLALVDNTLIFTKINQADIQAVSQIVGYLLLKNYFPERVIKDHPQIQMISRNDYQILRGKEADSRIASLETKIQIFQSNILHLSSDIQNDKTLVDIAKQEKDAKAAQIVALYNSCLKEGVTKNGTFYLTYTPEYCALTRDHALKENDKDTKSVDDAEARLQADQKQLSIYLYYDNFFKTQRAIITAQKKGLAFELGIFEPDNSIRIALDTTSSHAIADYLETLTHEYLHYTSYIGPGKQLTSLFFEEGLTEYFARQIIAENLDVKTNVGYPVYAKVIEAITQMIPETELAEIYFSKDQKALETALDRVYGEKFYAQNEILFESLQYASNAKQTLKLANTLMDRIGGKHLTEKDLQSSRSDF
jgi:hypothetical protein